MLIENLHKDMMKARFGNNKVAKSILPTLYSEAAKVGKDKRNGASTDEEVIATAKKFIANAEETARLLRERGLSDSLQKEEISIVSAYLPKQMSNDELKDHVSKIIIEMNLSGPKAMGTVMAQLKIKFAGQYDGKIASEVVKGLLSS